MNRSKIIFYVFLAVLVLQAELSVGKPVNPIELKNLLTEALKLVDCVRLVRVQQPIPLRFRRGTPGEKFQCTITLD